MIIRPHGPSNGALAIKTELRNRGVRCWVSHKPSKNHRALIVNWGGAPRYVQDVYPRVLNRHTAVMTNKLQFFQHVGHTDDVLEWTTDPEVAKGWKKVVCRTMLNASEGKGIIIWQHEGELPAAPLYTKYSSKSHEYRIHYAHTGFGDVRTLLHAQRKVFVKAPDRQEPKDWNVRSHANGFIFQSEELNTVPMPVQLAVVDVGLKFAIDFCAFDVLYSERTGKARVIEGNTAPGVEGKTVSVYADYFQERNK